jgi:hypothetical protein
VPQTPESSAPHCIGCPEDSTILYDHCKSHAHWVEPDLLIENAKNLKTCETEEESDCVDDFANLKDAKIFLARGECRTYTGPAVENTATVYKGLGASEENIIYFDLCNPDGSKKPGDTRKMCLEHTFGPSTNSKKGKRLANWVFDQKQFVDDKHVGFAEFGYIYLPEACEDSGTTVCGLQIVFHGCGSASLDNEETWAYAESNNVVIIHPNVPFGLNGNSSATHCNAGTDMAGNCKEISRGCWDGYG